MPELTQKELDVLNIKAKLFEMIREKETLIIKSNQIQEMINQHVIQLNKIEERMKE